MAYLSIVVQKWQCYFCNTSLLFFYAEILPRVFGIGEEQLTVMTRDHNFSALQEYGGACIIIFESKFESNLWTAN